MSFSKPNRPVNRVFIHCSASDRPDHDHVAVIRRWHLARGWKDVGYHFFITKAGAVQGGRSLEQTPAAQKGNNAGTIAICLHGLAIERFTAAQHAALRQLCDAINRAYGGAVTFHGHCEVANKSCPVIDYRQVLGLDNGGRMNGRPPPPIVAGPGSSVPASAGGSPSMSAAVLGAVMLAVIGLIATYFATTMGTAT